LLGMRPGLKDLAKRRGRLADASRMRSIVQPA